MESKGSAVAWNYRKVGAPLLAQEIAQDSSGGFMHVRMSALNFEVVNFMVCICVLDLSQSINALKSQASRDLGNLGMCNRRVAKVWAHRVVLDTCVCELIVPLDL